MPLLCLHGGPGFTHYYLEPLEALAEHRRVIFYDQLGCGRSDRPDDLSLWTVDRFVEELQARVPPRPVADGLERSFAEAGYDVYNTMNGPSEFTVTGTLKTWDIMDRLPEISVPALLVGGRYDECTPGHLADMHARIAGSELVTIEDASHLCFAEQPAEFNQVISRFFDRTEAATRP